jgi:hypothetical protein
MRPEALALFGLQEHWRVRVQSADIAQWVIHLPSDIAIEADRQQLAVGQSGLGASSAVFVSAISWLLSVQAEGQVSLRSSSDQTLQIEPGTGLRFESDEVLTAAGKRRLCESLLALRAQLRQASSLS